MKLQRLTERIWYDPFEEARDRPNLGYIRGDRWSVAVDAGHSAAHTAEFYAALREAGLPLPSVTVLTHWHWDHTFGMHAVHGLCVANEDTQRELADFRGRIAREGTEMFFAMHESIRREYADGQLVVVTLADVVFRDELVLEPGGCTVRLYRTPSPHTEDSTLILVPEERVLFVGDAAGGVFPTWEKAPALCALLADTLAAADADTVLEGHWHPAPLQELIDELRADAQA